MHLHFYNLYLFIKIYFYLFSHSVHVLCSQIYVEPFFSGNGDVLWISCRLANIWLLIGCCLDISRSVILCLSSVIWQQTLQLCFCFGGLFFILHWLETYSNSIRIFVNIDNWHLMKFRLINIVWFGEPHFKHFLQQIWLAVFYFYIS